MEEADVFKVWGRHGCEGRPTFQRFAATGLRRAAYVSTFRRDKRSQVGSRTLAGRWDTSSSVRTRPFWCGAGRSIEPARCPANEDATRAALARQTVSERCAGSSRASRLGAIAVAYMSNKEKSEGTLTCVDWNALLLKQEYVGVTERTLSLLGQAARLDHRALPDGGSAEDPAAPAGSGGCGDDDRSTVAPPMIRSGAARVFDQWHHRRRECAK